MRRRDFLGVLGGATVTWPFVARAQHHTKLPIIGFLANGSPIGWENYIALSASMFHSHCSAEPTR